MIALLVRSAINQSIGIMVGGQPMQFGQLAGLIDFRVRISSQLIKQPCLID
jgi:hypothetical protein